MDRDYLAERIQISPFDLNPSAPATPASVTFSKPPSPSVAFFGETRSHQKKQALQPSNNGHDILFRGPAFKRDVQDFFGITGHGQSAENIGGQSTKHYSMADVAPVYRAEDDDLAVWKKHIEAGTEVKEDEAQRNAERGKSAEQVMRDNIHQEILHHGVFDDSSEDERD